MLRFIGDGSDITIEALHIVITSENRVYFVHNMATLLIGLYIFSTIKGKIGRLRN